MLNLLLISLMLFGYSVSADTGYSPNSEATGVALYVAPQCPSISSDYNKALSTLRELKAEVLSQAGCESIEQATARLEEIVKPGRGQAYDIIRSSKGKMLGSRDAAIVEAYATQVGQAASDIFGLMGISDCPMSKEKKTLVYKSLMGLSFDAISGLSGVVGPYGAPLSVGITALKGVLSGVYSYNKSNKGYKFNVSTSGRDEAKLYVQSLCTFYDFKKEAELLLNASDRKNSYLNLEQHLNRKISVLTTKGYCEGCDQLLDLVDSYESKANHRVKNLVKKINQQSDDNLGDHLLDALQTKLWLAGQMNKLEEEEMIYNESIGPALLGKELEELEDFLIYTETSDFIDWIFDEAKSSYKDFRSDVRSWTVISQTELEAFNFIKGTGRLRADVEMPTTSIRKPREFLSVYDYKQYLVTHQNKFLPSATYKDPLLVESKYDKSIRVLKNVNRFISSHNEYCNFFKLAGYYDAVHRECNNVDMDKINEAFLRQTMPDPGLSNYLKTHKTQQLRFSKMSNKQEEWNKHLPALFEKWNQVNDRQINLLFAK